MVETLGNTFHMTFPPDFGVFPGPVSQRYMEPRGSLKQMTTAVLRARNAFLPLIVMCSYIIALTPGVHTENAPWMKALMDRGVEAQWVQNVRQLPIGSFSPEYMHVCVVVHQGCHFPEQIPRFVKAGVPLWIYFHKDAKPLKLCYEKTPIRENYLPSPSEYEQAEIHGSTLEAPILTPHVSTSDLPSATDAGDVAHRDGPEPHTQSRQLRGETWQEFFAREEVWQKNREATETAEDRRARLYRAEQQKSHPLPGKRGPKVFEWEEDSGYWLRELLTRGLADDRFGYYPDSQCRYNAFRKEWDLCKAFDPGADQPNWWEEVDGDMPEPDPVAPEPAHVEPISPTLWGEDLSLEQERPEQDMYLVIEPAETILTSRYSFALVGEKYDRDPRLKMSKGNKDWPETRKTLGCTEQGSWNGPAPEHVSDEVAHMMQPATIPAHMCDLSLNHLKCIMYQTDLMKIQRHTKGGDVYYLIIPCGIKGGGEREPAWDLVVRDPTTALECVRRFGGAGRQMIARHFMLTGRAFATRRLMSNPPPPNARTRPPVGMGWRGVSWHGTPHDYARYWFNLRDWMTTSRARAALMSGGIAWLVLAGPDYDGYGQYVQFNGDERGSWDNELTEDDMLVICGVYKIFTGNGDQMSDSSWWPKLSTWQGSSMDMGYWSPQCEEWYQHRRALITSGDVGGAPKTAQRWREALQGWRPRKKFINCVQVQSALVLSDETRRFVE
ncbi:hypothetical protein FIBSPDRAFT_890215 [Athelia psychrophila]|uniref:Uncharacterized protein n=1 Tax=Athelia psychrophila TaxID=1759441 RepID=A0A166L4U6_9AGAM|nr:hypothetical protein FIBSPDRAFT_890215 [Fibularhizoctonia sp. CBS 109695]